ncbi:hypothetical protein ABEB36_014544 [Hypothenemus hampei]|uniref:Uncharacterized protein n=1 Tax=Hypothenemus hampei TaxID=57062 RepID=A0ABD1E2E2_HYPHA
MLSVNHSNGSRVIKQYRIRGEAYVDHKKNLRTCRPMLLAPCSSKKETSLQQNLGSMQDQRVFLSQHIITIKKKRSTTVNNSSRRSFTNNYYLTVSGEGKKICRGFFMPTHNVTDALMRSCKKN